MYYVLPISVIIWVIVTLFQQHLKLSFKIFLKSTVQFMPPPFNLEVIIKVVPLESINYAILFKLKAATPNIQVPAPPSHYYQGITVFLIITLLLVDGL